MQPAPEAVLAVADQESFLDVLEINSMTASELAVWRKAQVKANRTNIEK